MAVNGLAVAKFVSCAGDAVGDVLGARPGVYYFRCPPGFCQQGTNEPSVWADEFEIGLASRPGSARPAVPVLMRQLRRRGARFNKAPRLVPALAFMFASTNLVIELGAVLWVLMGWTFVARGSL